MSAQRRGRCLPAGAAEPEPQWVRLSQESRRRNVRLLFAAGPWSRLAGGGRGPVPPRASKERPLARERSNSGRMPARWSGLRPRQNCRALASCETTCQRREVRHPWQPRSRQEGQCARGLWQWKAGRGGRCAPRTPGATPPWCLGRATGRSLAVARSPAGGWTRGRATRTEGPAPWGECPLGTAAGCQCLAGETLAPSANGARHENARPAAGGCGERHRRC